jgi:hypothetical protein
MGTVRWLNTVHCIAKPSQTGSSEAAEPNSATRSDDTTTTTTSQVPAHRTQHPRNHRSPIAKAAIPNSRRRGAAVSRSCYPGPHTLSAQPGTPQLTFPPSLHAGDEPRSRARLDRPPRYIILRILAAFACHTPNTKRRTCSPPYGVRIRSEQTSE